MTQLGLESGRGILEAFRSLSSKSKHETLWGYEGTIGTLHSRGLARLAMYMPWFDLAQYPGIMAPPSVWMAAAAKRLEAKKTTIIEQTHLSSEEKMTGLRRMHLVLENNTSCTLVVTHHNVSGLCRRRQALTARMDRVKDHWT